MSVITYRLARIYTKKDPHGYSADWVWSTSPASRNHGAYDKIESIAISKVKTLIDAEIITQEINNKFFRTKLV